MVTLDAVCGPSPCHRARSVRRVRRFFLAYSPSVNGKHSTSAGAQNELQLLHKWRCSDERVSKFL